MKKKERDFIWYGVRISFYIMIGMWIFFSFFINVENIIFQILSIIWIIIIVFNFIASIIHLTKHKEKSFAIVSLVFSSILIIFVIIGFIIGLIEGYKEI